MKKHHIALSDDELKLIIDCLAEAKSDDLADCCNTTDYENTNLKYSYLIIRLNKTLRNA